MGLFTLEYYSKIQKNSRKEKKIENSINFANVSVRTRSIGLVLIIR